MSTSRRTSLITSLTLVGTGLAAAMAVAVLPAGAVGLGQGPEVDLLATPVNLPVSAPHPMDISLGLPPVT